MSGVERLHNGETRFRIRQHAPLTKGGAPTYEVFDYLHHASVGAATSLREAAFICNVLSNPADAPRVIEEYAGEIARQLALLDEVVTA